MAQSYEGYVAGVRAGERETMAKLRAAELLKYRDETKLRALATCLQTEEDLERVLDRFDKADRPEVLKLLRPHLRFRYF
jgi:hypothetical protein